MPPQCWTFLGLPWDPGILSIEGPVCLQSAGHTFLGCPWDPGILSIEGSVYLRSAGDPWGVPGIPGYLVVLRDLYASTVLDIPGTSLGSRDT